MKIALGVEYLGTDFHGWQIQKSGLRTVQGVVEPALSKIANHPVRVYVVAEPMLAFMHKSKSFILKLKRQGPRERGSLEVMRTYQVM